MKRIILVSLLVLQTVAITGCNTMAGAGQDVSHAGHEVTGEANENR
jgi:entericidin B